MRKLLLLSTIALLPFASEASADPIYTYQYTGQPFDYSSAGVEASQFTSSNYITFDFSTSTPIAPNVGYTLVDLSGTPNPTLLSWSISDGTNSYSSSTGTFNQSATTGQGLLYQSEVVTDANGDIVSWWFGAQQSGGQYSIPNGPLDQLGVTIISCGPVVAYCFQQSVGHLTPYAGEFDQINPPDGSTDLYSGGADSPGIWAAPISSSDTVVPEPATLALLGVGLLGLVTARRRVPGNG